MICGNNRGAGKQSFVRPLPSRRFVPKSAKAWNKREIQMFKGLAASLAIVTAMLTAVPVGMMLILE
jgi:hypothetical protein